MTHDGLRRDCKLMSCGAGCSHCGAMRKNNNTNSDNQPDKMPKRQNAARAKPKSLMREATRQAPKSAYPSCAPSQGPLSAIRSTTTRIRILRCYALQSTSPCISMLPAPGTPTTVRSASSTSGANAITIPLPKRGCATTSPTSKPSRPGSPKRSLILPQQRSSSSWEF